MLEIGDMEKLKFIRVEDERVFPYIVSIMNGCFGKNFKSIYSCQGYVIAAFQNRRKDSHTGEHRRWKYGSRS